MPSPTPFTINVPQEKIEAILKKVRAYEWHEMPEIAPGADRWAYGTDIDYMKELCGYWVDKFDWRAAEKNLNRFPQFRADVDGHNIHFIHVKGSGANPETVLLTHGWPGSVFEFLDVIERLAHPETCGGKADDGVNLVIPSLPGYAFGGKLKTPIGPRGTAALWDKLMRDVLGYQSYIAQGGDWGAVVSGWLAYDHGVPKGGCKAVHLNMFGLRPAVLPETDEEKQWAQGAAMVFELESAYLRLQMTKPQTLSYGMMDSPVGTAAWIVEKFHGWSDRRGKDGSEHIENAFSKDQILTNLMIYLVTGTFNTATWFYRGLFEEGGNTMAPGTKVEVPTGIANFPKEFLRFPPRSMIEKGYNVVHWTDFEHGGHFAALETGPVFADDVRAFVQLVKG
ncbi:MAG: epoxide hydrolase [Parvibaculum sp.]|uniref:epoxide hydrolase family protein n=1 Tax=Parvibaculum sp. TaxID=2024848 RepID=UPI002727F80F|nr:epoxide hydrolase family protein [Parvibaculum sp.]MDO8840632.1 epoxide hydrolase [Parvibaculum sp.]